MKTNIPTGKRVSCASNMLKCTMANDIIISCFQTSKPPQKQNNFSDKYNQSHVAKYRLVIMTFSGGPGIPPSSWQKTLQNLPKCRQILRQVLYTKITCGAQPPVKRNHKVLGKICGTKTSHDFPSFTK